MGALSSYGGEGRTTAYYNGNPTSEVASYTPGTTVASGALTADTYPGTGQLEITGQGVLEFAIAYAADATARTITAKIVVDGTTVIEQAKAVSAANTGVSAAGWCYMNSAATRYVLVPTNIVFKQSLKIFIKSSLTETDKVSLKYMARVS